MRGVESVQPVRGVQPLRRERVQPVQSMCGFGVQSLQSLRGDVELGLLRSSPFAR